VAFSPDGNRLATGDGYRARVWDADNAREFLILKRQAVPAFSLDGKRLLSSGLDQTVNIWNPAD